MRVSSGRTHWGLLGAIATWISGLDPEEPEDREVSGRTRPRLHGPSCYRFRALDGGRFRATNPAQGLSSLLGAQGLSVRLAGEEQPSLAHRLLAWGRDGSLRPLVGTGPTLAGSQLEVRRRGLVERHEDLLEWYGNDPHGVELGFLVPRAPLSGPDSGPLVLELRLDGGLEGRVSADGRAVAFLRGGTVPVLYYRDLWVVDTRGRELCAHLSVDRDRLQLRIDDAGAAYPLLVA